MLQSYPGVEAEMIVVRAEWINGYGHVEMWMVQSESASVVS